MNTTEENEDYPSTSYGATSLTAFSTGDAKSLQEVKRVKGWTSLRITVEPLLFSIGFVLSYTNGVTVDLLENYICQHDYKLSGVACFNMTTEMRTPVDSKTATMTMLISIMDGICPAFVSLFVGPWSDTNGRKMIILIPTIGHAVCYLLYGLLSFFPHLPISIYLIPPAFLSLLGSFSLIGATVASYFCDVFEHHERAFRFSVGTFFFLTGGILGNILATKVFNAFGKWGFQGIFFTAFLVVVSAIVFIIAFLEETIHKNKRERRDLFDLTHVKGVLQLLFLNTRKRQITLILLIICITCESILSIGEMKVTYLVGKTAFSWNLGDFNLLLTIILVIKATIPPILLWIFMSKLKISRHILMVAFCLFMVLIELLKSFSSSNIFFCVSAALLPLGSAVADIWTGEFYNVLQEEAIGKASSVISIIFAVSNLTSPPIFMELYKYLLPSRTLYVFILSSGIFFVCNIASMILAFMNRSGQSKFTKFENPT